MADRSLRARLADQRAFRCSRRQRPDLKLSAKVNVSWSPAAGVSAVRPPSFVGGGPCHHSAAAPVEVSRMKPLTARSRPCSDGAPIPPSGRSSCAAAIPAATEARDGNLVDLAVAFIPQGQAASVRNPGYNELPPTMVPCDEETRTGSIFRLQRRRLVCFFCTQSTAIGSTHNLHAGVW